MALCALIVVVGIGLWLRFDGFADEPVHADEATQGYLLDTLLREGVFIYDPTHHHGPVPHWINALWLKLGGHVSWETLETWHLRMVPMVASCLTLGLIFLIAWQYSPMAGILAAVLAVTSPVLLHYARVGIPEGVFTLLAVGATWTFYQSVKTLRFRYWILTGVLAGLLAGTKETWVIVMASCAAAAIPMWRVYYRCWKRMLLGVLVMGGVFWIVVLAEFTNFFTHGAGVRDFVAAYWVYETDSGHDKPWYYYFLNILLPHGRGLGEPALWLSVCGLCVILWRAIRGSGWTAWNAPCFFAVAAVVQVICYALISYKTPWLMLAPAALASVAGGYFLALILQCLPGGWRMLALTLCVVVFGWWCGAVKELTNRRFSDFRNPLAYVPTSPQLPKLIKHLDAVVPTAQVAVVGGNYWPLPWYLRRQSGVGYFEVLPDTSTFDVVLIEDSSPEKIENSDMSESFWGLRTDTFLRCYLRQQ